MIAMSILNPNNSVVKDSIALRLSYRSSVQNKKLGYLALSPQAGEMWLLCMVTLTKFFILAAPILEGKELIASLWTVLTVLIGLLIFDPALRPR